MECRLHASPSERYRWSSSLNDTHVRRSSQSGAQIARRIFSLHMKIILERSRPPVLHTTKHYGLNNLIGSFDAFSKKESVRWLILQRNALAGRSCCKLLHSSLRLGLSSSRLPSWLPL